MSQGRGSVVACVLARPVYWCAVQHRSGTALCERACERVWRRPFLDPTVQAAVYRKVVAALAKTSGECQRNPSLLQRKENPAQVHFYV